VPGVRSVVTSPVSSRINQPAHRSTMPQINLIPCPVTRSERSTHLATEAADMSLNTNSGLQVLRFWKRQ